MKTKKVKKPWEHTGGGCMVVGNSRYPCDDEYEHKVTKKIIRFATTMEAHFQMPGSRGGGVSEAEMRQLKKTKGVKVVKP